MPDSELTEEKVIDGGSASAGGADFSEYNLPTDLTAFQVLLLYFDLSTRSRGKVTLQSALKELYPEDINQGRFYPSLDRLFEAGLINKQTVEGNKRRKEYT